MSDLVTNFCFAEKHIENDSLATKALSHKLLKSFAFSLSLRDLVANKKSFVYKWFSRSFTNGYWQYIEG